MKNQNCFGKSILLLGVLLLGTLNLAIGDEGQHVSGVTDDEKKVYVVDPNSGVQEAEFHQELVNVLTPHVYVTRVREFLVQNLFQTKGPSGNSLYFLTVFPRGFPNPGGGTPDSDWDSLARSLQDKLGNFGKVFGPLVSVGPFQPDLEFSKEAEFYGIYPREGDCQGTVENVLQNELFRPGGLQIHSRAVRHVEHRLLQGPDPNNNPLYLWGFKVEGYAPALTSKFSPQIVNSMGELLGNCALVSPKLALVNHGPLQEAIHFTHQVVRNSPYYIAGPQQAIPPDGELVIGTRVRILEEAGSFVRIQSEDNIIGFVAEGDLQKIGDNPQSVERLIQDLNSSDLAERMNAAQALGEMGVGGKVALSKLQTLAQDDPDEYVRHFAQEAAGKIQKSIPADSVPSTNPEKGSKSIANLIQDLESSKHEVRMQAAQALGGLGVAVPKLQELAKNDPDEYVRHFAQEAIDKIQQSFPFDTARINDEAIGRTPAIHGMAVVGFEKIYLHHLPMFNETHGVQMILEVELEEEAGTVYRAQSRRGFPYPLITLVPKKSFPLLELGDSRMTFTADLFDGHFERGGEKLASDFAVTIKKIVYKRTLNPNEERPKFSEYILFGTSQETFLAHKISGVPNYDQILSVARENPLEQQMIDGAVVVSLGLTDQSVSAMKEGQHGKGMMRGLVAGGSDLTELPFPFQVRQEYYFEVEELSFNGFLP